MMSQCSDETLANKISYQLELFDMYAFKITCWALIFIFRLQPLIQFELNFKCLTC